MVHHVTTPKPYQCEYDRVRTLTVHHTNKRRTRQCKYDRVRTQRYTIQTRRQKWVENINGTPRNYAKALSMWVRPRADTNGTPYKQEKDINVITTVCVHNGTPYKQDKETSMWVRPRAYTTRRHDGDNHMINGRTRQSSSADVNNNRPRWQLPDDWQFPVERSRVRPPEIVVKHGGKRIRPI